MTYHSLLVFRDGNLLYVFFCVVTSVPFCEDLQSRKNKTKKLKMSSSSEKRNPNSTEYSALIHEDGTSRAQQLLEQCSSRMKRANKYAMEKCHHQQETNWWCSLSSMQLGIAYMTQSPREASFQSEIYQEYINGQLDTRYGISLEQLGQILQYLSLYNTNTFVEEEENKEEDGNKNKKEEEEEEEDEENENGRDEREKIKKKKKSGGHWSPVTCVTKDMKHIHIGESNPKRFKPHWVATDDFVLLMATKCYETDTFRGYIKVTFSTLYFIQWKKKNHIIL
ncbi:hypothetical protein RFI_23591, partial [Reticulomyxa filosa]